MLNMHNNIYLLTTCECYKALQGTMQGTMRGSTGTLGPTGSKYCDVKYA